MARTQEARMDRRRVTAKHGNRQVQPSPGVTARNRTNHLRVVTARARGRARV